MTQTKVCSKCGVEKEVEGTDSYQGIGPGKGLPYMPTTDPCAFQQAIFS